MPIFDDIHQVLDTTVHAHDFASVDDPNGIWRARSGEVTSVGVLLEPCVGLETWISEKGIDALVIHRPWGLPEHLPGDPGVLAYHLAFDERLTVGFNPLLASFLGLTGLERLGHKAGRPIGMIGNIARTDAAAFTSLVACEFGVSPTAVGPEARDVDRVAVAGASWPHLIDEAVKRGADVFVTGASRAAARSAANEAGLLILSLGHSPVEMWGLKAIAGVLRGTFPGLEVHMLSTGMQADWRSTDTSCVDQ